MKNGKSGKAKTKNRRTEKRPEGEKAKNRKINSATERRLPERIMSKTQNPVNFAASKKNGAQAGKTKTQTRGN